VLETHCSDGNIPIFQDATHFSRSMTGRQGVRLVLVVLAIYTGFSALEHHHGA